MTGDIDDVVGASHHRKIAVLVFVSRVCGQVVAGKLGEVSFAVSFVVIP
jgi:hypothetical protein